MKPLKILVLDNTREEKSFGSRNIVELALKTAPQGSEIMVRRSPEQDLPSIDISFDAIILSGSATSCLETKEAWIKPYDDFVLAHILRETPILGICYGHQTLARCFARMGGQEVKLKVAKDAEFGWQKIRITAEVPLLTGLKSEFMTYESHYEEVYELPEGAKKFAETDRCQLQGFQFKDKPIFGIQFHPEYTVEQAEASLASKLKSGVRSDWILNPGKGDKLFDENVGKVIFGNFFRITASKQ